MVYEYIINVPMVSDEISVRKIIQIQSVYLQMPHFMSGNDDSVKTCRGLPNTKVESASP